MGPDASRITAWVPPPCTPPRPSARLPSSRRLFRHGRRPDDRALRHGVQRYDSRGRGVGGLRRGGRRSLRYRRLTVAVPVSWLVASGVSRPPQHRARMGGGVGASQGDGASSVFRGLAGVGTGPSCAAAASRVWGRVPRPTARAAWRSVSPQEPGCCCRLARTLDAGSMAPGLGMAQLLL